MRRGLTAAALTVLAVMLVASWAAPRLSARAASWLEAVPVRGKTIRVADEIAVQRDGAQPLRAAPPNTSKAVTTDARFIFDMAGVLLRVPHGTSPASLHVAVRTSLDGVSWSDWWTLALDAAEPRGSVESRLDATSDPAWVGPSRYLQYRIGAMAERGFPRAPTRVLDVRFSLLNAEGNATMPERVLGSLKSTVATIARLPRVATAAAATEAPTIVSRAQWGADETWRAGSPSYATVKMAFVHHTDGSDDYTPAQSAAIVRGIYYYHTLVRGWNDIGYNFLIDRYGTVFEGRYGGVTQGPIGAHVYGFNTHSTGVAVMGSFNDEPPPEAAISSLERLLAWKLQIHGIDPRGTVIMAAGATEKFVKGVPVPFPVIAGHRQANYTICPGDAFFRLLPGIRSAVAGADLPTISNVSVSSPALSPNDDGVLDRVKGAFAISGAADWTVELRRPGGAIVRAFSGRGTAAAFTWDGRDKNGAVVRDGSYTLAASATSTFGAAHVVTATIVVDTMAPTFERSGLRLPLFSPNGDRVIDLTKVDFATSEALSGRLRVKAGDGSVIRSSAWRSLNPGGHTFAWDGAGMVDGVSAPAPNGRYSLTVEIRDPAGNHADVVYPVRLDRSLGYPGMSPTSFSPNGDGKADTASLSFRLFSPAAVTVRIAGTSGVVRTLTLGPLPTGIKRVSWNGRTGKGRLVPDGSYRVTAVASTPGRAVSVAAGVTKDTAPPMLSAPHSVTTTPGTDISVSCEARDALSKVASITATVRGPSGTIEGTRTFGWVRTGARNVWAFRPSMVGRFTIKYVARDLALNSALPVVTVVKVK
jgi:flagellar hook assembly protein FlgD